MAIAATFNPGDRIVGARSRSHLTLAKLIGHGGEGDVFSLRERPAMVAKLYRKPVDARLAAKLDHLASSRQRPTALFSNRLAFALSTMFYLLQSGLRVPRDISIVLGDSHSLIDTALPEITRYRDVNLSHADRAVRIAQALLAGHHVPLKPSLFIPTFIAGSTLGAPPEAERDAG